MARQLEHPPKPELLRFLRGETTEDETRGIVRHLLTGCPSCRAITGDAWSQEVVGRSRSGDYPDFERIFTRAAGSAAALEAKIEAEREAARRLYEELRKHPFERRLLLAANSRRFRTYGFSEWLLEEAFRGGFRDPQETVELARIALEIVRRLPADRYGKRLLHDLRGRAWGTLGNGHRIASRMREAEAAIDRGLEHLDRGTGDPSEKARLLSFRASLRAGQRRFPEALEIDLEILRLYTELGDRHMVGRTQGHRAFVLRFMGEEERALEMSRKALSNLDVERDPREALSARQGLAQSLMRLDRLAEAATELEELREDFAARGNELDVLRCDWSLGRILLQSGDAPGAERQLRLVRDRFVELAIPYDAAQANLDLAVALLEQGKLGELKERLTEALPIFRGLGIHRETIAALSFLKQATELEKVSVGLIRATARFVESSRRNPGLPFRSEKLTEAP